MAYLDLYRNDVPVLVTTDSILFAIHNSYDVMLKRVEEEVLIPALGALLAAAHAEVAGMAPPPEDAVLAQGQQDADLFFEANSQTFEFKPTIADVHTDPNTSSVLHVGTGFADLMVLVANTSCGLKAYAGPASSYFERIQSGFHRMTDEEWTAQLAAGNIPDRPAWTSEFLVH